MIKTLNDNWYLNFGNHKRVATIVPTSVYSVLLQNNYIEDPFYGLNEYKIRELSRMDAEFGCEFEITDEEIEKEHIILRFACIDTIATVYVNNIKVGNCDNMFTMWNFDIKKAAVQGMNEIRVEIKSPIVYAERAQDAYKLWGMDETMCMRGYQHIRKAHCMFGWDWGPQLPDMGIYRNVSLLAYDGSILEDFSVIQEHKIDGGVELTITGEFSDGLIHDGTVSIYSPDNDCFTAQLVDGACKITIANPMLWWPNGYGNQYLYHVIVEDNFGNDKQCKVGLRTITVSTAEDKWGNEFAFVVNGIKIFSMGADYIPEDSLIPRTNRKRTEQLIQSCIDSNFNTIRVWGGGYYPDDYFFDLCDEYGLVVWQDFMFACAVYNVTDEFEESLKKEFTHNIRRLRNHACLGLFCGNNEMEIAWVEWKLPNNEKIKQDYIYLYERLLPRMVKKYAAQIFYWPASPSNGGGFEDPNNFNRGDVHYWEVWHGNKPFEEYRKYYFRYCSEFGFEAFPALDTLRTIAKEKDFNPFSRVMESHQKCDGGNKKILNYLADYYLYPKNFESFVYASQLLQADAIKYGVEHFRRYRGRCMGAVYWQLNDIWPGPSWASVDYYGRWKALQYYAKRFFAPILLSAHLNEKCLVLNVSNETMNNFEGRIKAGIRDNDFNNLDVWEANCSVESLSTSDILIKEIPAFDAEEKYNLFLYYQLYDEKETLISEESILFVKPKHFNFEEPNIRSKVKEENGKLIVELAAEKYARSVFVDFEGIDIQLSSNYIDLVDENKRIITINTNSSDNLISIETLQKQIKILSIFNIA